MSNPRSTVPRSSPTGLGTHDAATVSTTASRLRLWPAVEHYGIRQHHAAAKELERCDTLHRCIRSHIDDIRQARLTPLVYAVRRTSSSRIYFADKLSCVLYASCLRLSFTPFVDKLSIYRPPVDWSRVRFSGILLVCTSLVDMLCVPFSPLLYASCRQASFFTYITARAAYTT